MSTGASAWSVCILPRGVIHVGGAPVAERQRALQQCRGRAREAALEALHGQRGRQRPGDRQVLEERARPNTIVTPVAVYRCWRRLSSISLQLTVVCRRRLRIGRGGVLRTAAVSFRVFRSRSGPVRTALDGHVWDACDPLVSMVRKGSPVRVRQRACGVFPGAVRNPACAGARRASTTSPPRGRPAIRGPSPSAARRSRSNDAVRHPATQSARERSVVRYGCGRAGAGRGCRSFPPISPRRHPCPSPCPSSPALPSPSRPSPPVRRRPRPSRRRSTTAPIRSGPGRARSGCTRSAPARTACASRPGSSSAPTPDPVGYTLYPRTGPGFAVDHAIGRHDGRRKAYLGATVLRSGFDGRVVTVTVRTAKLARPLALQISARGTA